MRAPLGALRSSIASGFSMDEYGTAIASPADVAIPIDGTPWINDSKMPAHGDRLQDRIPGEISSAYGADHAPPKLGSVRESAARPSKAEQPAEYRPYQIYIDTGEKYLSIC